MSKFSVSCYNVRILLVSGSTSVYLSLCYALVNHLVTNLENFKDDYTNMTSQVKTLQAENTQLTSQVNQLNEQVESLSGETLTFFPLVSPHHLFVLLHSFLTR